MTTGAGMEEAENSDEEGMNGCLSRTAPHNNKHASFHSYILCIRITGDRYTVAPSVKRSNHDDLNALHVCLDVCTIQHESSTTLCNVSTDS